MDFEALYEKDIKEKINNLQIGLQKLSIDDKQHLEQLIESCEKTVK